MKHPLYDFFSPIGKVVVVFNEIDTSLIILAGGMCLPEFHAVTGMMAEASFGRKLDALKCICDEKLKDATLHDELILLLKQLQEAEDIRNRVCHTFWTGSSGGQMMKLKWSGKRKTGNQPNLRITKLQEVEEAGERIQKVFADLVKFMGRLQKLGVLKIKFVGE